MEQPGKQHQDRIEEVCPTCGVPRSEWLTEGVSKAGTKYCCEGCAQGTGCICQKQAAKRATEQ